MHGVHTAIVTPFAADGRVDLDAFEAMCARQIHAGVHGIVACGTTGETPTLDDAEWEAVVSAAVRVCAGRVPVSAGIGTNHTASTVRLAERAKALGADTGLLAFPAYNKPNPSGHRLHVDAALSAGLPLVLYHVPGRTAQTLPFQLLAELASRPGVVAVKEATGDLRYGGDVMRHTTTPVLSGDDFTFLGLLAQGGAGVVSVVSNVAPAQTVAVYELFRTGRVDEARGALAALWDLIGFLFAETNPVPCKQALAELGLCRPDVRLPLGPSSLASPRPLLDALGLS